MKFISVLLFLLFINNHAFEQQICFEFASLPEFSVVQENIRATVYHAIPQQCGRDYMRTADLSVIDTAHAHKLRWCAVSRDFLEKNLVRMGDTVYIESPYPEINGMWIIKDKMGRYYWKPLNKKELGQYYNDSTSHADLNIYKHKDGKIFKKVYQYNWIDFLSHPSKGIKGSWSNRDIVMLKKIKR